MKTFKSKTAHKKILKKLKINEDKYKLLVQTIPDVIFEIDSKGYFTFISDGIRELGYSPASLLGKHFKKITYPEDYETISRAMVLPKYEGKITGDKGAPKLFDERRTGKRMTRNLEARILSKGKKQLSTHCYVEVNSAGFWDHPVTDKKKNFLGSVGIIRNISERKRKEDELRKTKEELETQMSELKKVDELKSEFITTVSHEIRTPLSITNEGINLVLDEVAGRINETQKKFLSNAKNSLSRLLNLINDLLDMSKLEAGRLEIKRDHSNLCDLVKSIASSFQAKTKEKSIVLKTRLPKKELDIYVDEDKIFQVFTNLVGNAVKFTKKGFIEVGILDHKNKVLCYVKDTGVGISKYDLSQVFEKFRQLGKPIAGEKGTGLGLAISKRIIELHKGEIWVESERGKGAKFSFSLPKYSRAELFKEYIQNGIKDAQKTNSKMSLIVVSMKEFDKLKKKYPTNEIRSFLQDISAALETSLRRAGDVVVRNTGELIILLPECTKKGVIAVEERLEQALKDYLKTKKIPKLSLHVGTATYPDEAKTEEALIRKAKKS